MTPRPQIINSPRFERTWRIHLQGSWTVCPDFLHPRPP